MEPLLKFGGIIVLVAVGYFFGSGREKRHFEDIQRRERNTLKIPVRADELRCQDATDAFLVTGSVVIATDYFKQVMANLRTLIGGRITNYETLMDRARREAILRLKEEAIRKGATEIINLRINTASLDVMGVEIFASATAVKR